MNLAGGSRTLMRFIVSSSLRFRYLVVAAAVAMMVFGVLQIQNMRVDVFPEFAPPQVEVQTICTGLSTADVEIAGHGPLEQALNGIKGLDVMRSKSVPQLSVDRHGLQAGRRPVAGASGGPGAAGDGPEQPADLGGPAGACCRRWRRRRASCRSA